MWLDETNRFLLYVGFLPAVDSLTATPILLDFIISLTWTPPFSLDISNADPDIAGYCVGVVNSTTSLVIDSHCGITDTQYNYTVSPNDTECDTYTFTVTPVNIVGNGTSASVTQGILPSGELLHTFSFNLLKKLCTCIESMTPEFEDFTIGVIPNGNISLKFNLVCFVLYGSYSYISIARSRIYNNIKLIGMLNMNIARPGSKFLH